MERGVSAICSNCKLADALDKEICETSGCLNVFHRKCIMQSNDNSFLCLPCMKREFPDVAAAWKNPNASVRERLYTKSGRKVTTGEQFK